MNFDTLLLEMGTKLGFEDFGRSESGDVTVSFDNIIVTIDVFDEQIFFFTKIGSISSLQENKLHAYEFFLKRNNFGELNGYVGIDEVQNAITFASKVPLEKADANYLVRVLERHINSAEFLINHMKSGDFTESKVEHTIEETKQEEFNPLYLLKI